MNFTLCVEITNFIRLFCAKFLRSLSPFFFLFSFLFPITFPSVSVHFLNTTLLWKAIFIRFISFRVYFHFFLLHHVSRFGHAKSIGHCYDSWLEIREPFLCMPSDSWLSLTLKRRKGWGYKTIKPAGVSDFSYFRVKQWNYEIFAGCPPRWQGQTVSLHGGVLTNVSQLM